MLITVRVGPNRESFHVHKDLIGQTSAFFQNACKGGFKEADGIINLPGQEPKIFKHFIYWLYTGKIRGYYYPPSLRPTIKELKVAANEVLELSDKETLADLDNDDPAGLALNLANYRDVPLPAMVALYALAEFLQVRGLKDQIITSLAFVYSYNNIDRPKEAYVLFWEISNSTKELKPGWLMTPAKGINMA